MSILFDPGYFSKFKAEQMLNDAIIGANILDGYEDHLAVVDRFYADDIEASIEGCAVVTGKADVRSRVMAFLVPMHVFAEMGGINVSIAQSRL